MFFICFQDFK